MALSFDFSPYLNEMQGYPPDSTPSPLNLKKTMKISILKTQP